jgi:hypothetical protein
MSKKMGDSEPPPIEGNCAEESHAALAGETYQPSTILGICCKKSTFNKNSC